MKILASTLRGSGLRAYKIILYVKIACITRSCFLIQMLYRLVFRRRVNSFWIRLFYFVFTSWIGFRVLEALKPRLDHTSLRLRKLDLFFTSVSASTVSSMSVLEMEVFSDSQLQVMTALMLIGSEVFVSMVGLFYRLSNPRKMSESESRVTDHDHQLQMMELGTEVTSVVPEDHHLKYRCIRFLGFAVLFFLVGTHLAGVASVWLYFALNLKAKQVLESKELNLVTFSVFTVVSTFSSCGFIPTNENMVIFRKNSGLLLILIPQALAGNTLFPPCIRLMIWFLGKFVKKQESKNLLENTKDIGYLHFLPGLYSRLLVLTVLGFVSLQFVMLCSLEWGSDSLSGLGTGYERVIGLLFQSINSRHTGETIADISTFSAASLILFIVMMYLPPYTSFIPIGKHEESGVAGTRQKRSTSQTLGRNCFFSQISYLVIFVMLVCITERNKMKEDPINFSVLNIVVEVISAYGNVGFTTGYSCARKLTPDGSCVDKWIGFSGKWSDEGKIILIIVMFFGRLKVYSLNGGRAWNLL